VRRLATASIFSGFIPRGSEWWSIYGYADRKPKIMKIQKKNMGLDTKKVEKARAKTNESFCHKVAQCWQMAGGVREDSPILTRGGWKGTRKEVIDRDEYYETSAGYRQFLRRIRSGGSADHRVVEEWERGHPRPIWCSYSGTTANDPSVHASEGSKEATALPTRPYLPRFLEVAASGKPRGSANACLPVAGIPSRLPTIHGRDYFVRKGKNRRFNASRMADRRTLSVSGVCLWRPAGAVTSVWGRAKIADNAANHMFWMRR